MMNRVRALFDRTAKDAAAPHGRRPPDELQVAAAALLVTAAGVDADFDAKERATILKLLETRLKLTSEEAQTLLDAAIAASDRSNQLLGFTRAIKDRYGYDERVALVEMLWEVAYADGRVDEFESQLMRRIGGLIYVTDRDRGLARQRVVARLGEHGGS